MRKALQRFAVLSCLALSTGAALSQTKPAFEVASIKPAALDMAKVKAAIQNGDVPRLGARVDDARAEFIYVTLQDLVGMSYNVKSDRIRGPDWMASQRFDIFAKLPDGSSKNDVPQMLQALLEDRFKLALHRETGERQALALVVGEGGPKLKASSDSQPVDPDAPLARSERQIDGPVGPVRVTTDRNGETINMGANGTMRYAVDPADRTMHIEAGQVTMGGLADMLTTLLRATGGGLEVKDMTGLTGKYQVAIRFSLEDLKGGARDKWLGEPSPDVASDPGGGTSLFNPVESMGLKLVSRKVTVEQLVVDRAERTPAGN